MHNEKVWLVFLLAAGCGQRGDPRLSGPFVSDAEATIAYFESTGRYSPEHLEKIRPIFGNMEITYRGTKVTAHIVSDNDRELYRQVFKVFSDPCAYPILFHCWGGCDRGGTVAFLLHALLGLDNDSLICDYELSSLAIWGERSHLSDNFQSLLRVLLPFGDTKNDVGKQGENYLLSIGVTAKEIASIRNYLTERSTDHR